LSSEVFWSLLERFLNSPFEFIDSPKLVEIVNINPNKAI
jgi:hypothetical protein